MKRRGCGSKGSMPAAARIARRQHAGPEIGSHSVTGAGLGPARIAAVISSPLWGVSDVALRALKLRHGHVILSSVYDAPESCVTHVTCVYPLIAAAFEF